MKNTHLLAATMFALPLFAACTTTEVPPPVEVTPPPVEQTCYPINTLKKVVIPAVTESGFSIVSIETEDEQYFDEETQKWVTVDIPDIERKEPWTKVVEPERVIYVDQDNKEVTDICELNAPKVETPADTGTP